MKKSSKIILICFGIAFLLTAAVFYLLYNYSWKIGIDASCVVAEKHKIIGHSMEPVLKEGTVVRGLNGYYDCNEIKRDEIAILIFKSREETFVKKIAGLSGDSLEFRGDQAKLNGNILENSMGVPYLFSKASQRIIGIPLKDGKIPEERYLILSEEMGPSAFDSRQFGFIEIEHIKGKIIKIKNLKLWR